MERLSKETPGFRETCMQLRKIFFVIVKMKSKAFFRCAVCGLVGV